MTKTLLTILFVASTLIVGLFYFKPAWTTFGNIRQDTRDLQATNTELASLIENKDILIDSINRVSKTDLDHLDQAMPQGSHSAELLAFFEDIAGRNGLVLKSIDLSEKKEKAGEATAQGQPKPGLAIAAPKSANVIKEVPVTITLIGTYDSFKKFMNSLERSLRVVDIKTINFTGAGTTNVFSFFIQGKTYYQ